MLKPHGVQQVPGFKDEEFKDQAKVGASFTSPLGRG